MKGIDEMQIIFKYILVFLVSMVPLLELRGSIPIGLSTLLGDPLPVLPLYIICIIGNMLPVPLIFFFARRVLEWGADKSLLEIFLDFVLKKVKKQEKNYKKKLVVDYM